MSREVVAFFTMQNMVLVCRPEFDPEVFFREFPALLKERSRQVGGPKVKLAAISSQI